jgi:hypothetical protein
MAYQYFKRPDGTVVGQAVADDDRGDPPSGWKPATEAQWRAVETHYFRMSSGLVLDISERLGGNPYTYLNNGAVEIGRAEFDAELAAQYEKQAAQREAWIQERIEDGRDFSDFEKIGAKLEKTPRSLVKDA